MSNNVPLYLKPQGERVLAALGKFAYLTTDQMLAIGIAANRNTLNRNTLKPLCEMRGALIERRVYQDIPKQGKLPYLYKLTPKGATFLADQLEVPRAEIKFHSEKIQVVSGYYHRVAQSDFMIAFAQWMDEQGKELDFFFYDYEVTGNPREGKAISRTQARLYEGGRYKKPDMVARYWDEEKRRLLAVEIHNGKDSKRIAHQIGEYIAFLKKHVFERKFDHNKMMFVASVHENESTLNSVKQRLLAVPGFQELKPLFVFNLQEQVKTDFSVGWTLADEGRTALFRG